MKLFAIQKRKLRNSRPVRAGSRRREDGYVLLTLILVVALLGIFALIAAVPIKFEIERDQEQELIHRGVQYSRAIRAYYKKFGRYPTRLEDLDNTNNLRYLRKHYKDPLNKNKDFRLLHFGEQGVTLAGGIAGAIPAGAAGLNGSLQSGSAVGGSTLNGSGFGNSGVNSSGVFAQSSKFGGNSNSAPGADSNSQTTTGQPGTTPAPGSDPTQASAQVAPGTARGDTSSSSQQIIASGPIVGVASISRKNTIREFNKKKRYNEWQFLYDPAFDRGGLITTPYQPSLQTSALGQNNLQPGSGTGNSSSQSSFGQSPSGQSGFGNSNPGGSTPPVQPATTPPQQP